MKITGMQEVTVASDGISVDLVIWQKYHRRMEGLVEMTLEINPGLAELGPILPVGTTFKLPIVKLPTVPVRTDVVHLWS